MLKYRIKEKKGLFWVQKGLGLYFNSIGPFPTFGDAQSWINLHG